VPCASQTNWPGSSSSNVRQHQAGEGPLAEHGGDGVFGFGDGAGKRDQKENSYRRERCPSARGWPGENADGLRGPRRGPDSGPGEDSGGAKSAESTRRGRPLEKGEKGGEPGGGGKGQGIWDSGTGRIHVR